MGLTIREVCPLDRSDAYRPPPSFVALGRWKGDSRGVSKASVRKDQRPQCVAARNEMAQTNERRIIL
jgi:hypothetical protein